MFMRRLFWPLETILIKSGIFLEKMVHKENQHLSMDDLEQALEFIDNDELLEITPTSLRIHKKILDSRLRKRANLK